MSGASLKGITEGASAAPFIAGDHVQFLYVIDMTNVGIILAASGACSSTEPSRHLNISNKLV